ncbi:transmembrane sensor [Sphingomonas trueperi]|uniref:FecR family protein n=1 Tax=Sphingomonas trueperi TaxID=53317 RepID=UPI003397A1B1
MSLNPTRRAALHDAARWAMREDDAVLREAPPAAAGEVQAMLDDRALSDAMAQLPRLSDADIRALRSRRRTAIGTGGLLGIAAVLGIGGWHAGWYRAAAPAPLHYETARGQMLDVKLADGSAVHLNGATSLDVTLDDHRRSVTMQRGEAYFDVAHLPDRPFTVHAGGAATQVLGTAFDIDIAAGGVRLAVYRGKVRFGDAAAAVIVPAGWRTRFAEGRAQAPTRFDAAQKDWRDGWLDIDAMPLGDLVDALNRRGGPLIAPPPPSLRGLAVSGRFRLDSPQALLDAMGLAYGFRTARVGTQLRLESTGADDANSSRP